jgi:hypothetical protein
MSSRSPIARGVIVFAAALTIGTLLESLDLQESQAAAETQQLIRNGSVEEGVLFTPTSWDTTDAGIPTIRFDWDETEARTGKRSIHIFNTSDAIPLWHNWSQNFPGVNELGGKEVVFSAWVKTSQLTGQAYLLAQAFRDTVTIEALKTGEPRHLKRTEMGYKPAEDPQVNLGWARLYIDEELPEWTRFEVSLYVPHSTNLLFVRAGILGVGEVWFDDFSLEVREATPEKPFPEGENLLANAGFEDGLQGWDFSLAPLLGTRVSLSGDAHTGNYSALLESQRKPPVQMITTVFQVLNTRELSGKRLRMTGWIKTEELANSKAYLRIFASGLYGDRRLIVSQAISGTTDWTYITLEREIPEETTVVLAHAGFSTDPGKVYVDDLTLEVVGDATGAP